MTAPTVTSEAIPIYYAGNGSTTDFPWNNPVYATSDLKCILTVDATGVDTAQAYSTHFTVTIASGNGSATVTMGTAPASGETLCIYLDPDLTQTDTYTSGGKLPSEALQNQINRASLQAQGQQQQLNRSFKLPVTVDMPTDSVSAEVPKPTALGFLRWNAAATAMEYVTLANIADTIALPATIADGQHIRNDAADPDSYQTSALIEDDSGNFSGVNAIRLDNAPSGQTTTEGSFYWDSTNHCIAVKNDEADSTLQVGQENWIRVYNNSGADIPDGSAVYISGKEDVEDRPTVDLALADDPATSRFIGCATHLIGDGEFGYVTQFGVINGINTSAFSDGDPIWISTTSAGGFQNTEPTSPDTSVFVGYVLDSNASGNAFITTIGNTAGGAGTAAGDATQLTSAVRKGSAGTIAKGSPVYISGYNVGQDVTEVELADANGTSTYPAIGIASGSITNSSNGTIVVSGRLAGIDTSSWSVNDALYVSETVGTLTNVRPTAAASQVQAVARVLRSNASNGVIDVIGAGRTNDIPNAMDDAVFKLYDTGDSTALVDFDLSGISTATTRTKTLQDTSGTLAEQIDNSRAPDIILEDQKSSGTAGGTSSTGVNTRVLNTEVRDYRGECTLSSNQFTLTAGTYYVEFSAPAMGSGTHQTYVYNATGASTLVSGESVYSTSGDHTSMASRGSGVFTVAGSQALELRHYITSGKATDGLGTATGSSQTLKYARVSIWRVS